MKTIGETIGGLLRGRYPGKAMILTGLTIILTITILSLLAPYIAPYPPDAPSVPEEYQGIPLPPSREHLMGTTNLGYDVFSRILYGGRVILYVVILAAVISMSIGIPLGLISGYYGGKLDRVLSMIMDSIYAFPGIILAIAVASVLGASPKNAAISLSVVYVPTYFRMVRGSVLKLKQSLFVEAARSLGLPDRVILVNHILPNVAPTVLVVFGLGSTDAILTEAGLSFFGLTVSFPQPDWGLDLYMGKSYFLAGAWWMIFFPGLMITLLALGFALLGEGLAEKLEIRTER
ncbi:MAG: ABC transporter permease [Desulfurococcales archaeon]|nr:ABC transporter permease [Desulfurococcales archaeon]